MGSEQPQREVNESLQNFERESLSHTRAGPFGQWDKSTAGRTLPTPLALPFSLRLSPHPFFSPSSHSNPFALGPRSLDLFNPISARRQGPGALALGVPPLTALLLSLSLSLSLSLVEEKGEGGDGGQEKGIVQEIIKKKKKS